MDWVADATIAVFVLTLLALSPFVRSTIVAFAVAFVLAVFTAASLLLINALLE